LKKQQTINIYVYVNNRPEKHRFKNCRDWKVSEKLWPEKTRRLLPEYVVQNSMIPSYCIA
jgi:hypothetical protein